MRLTIEVTKKMKEDLSILNITFVPPSGSNLPKELGGVTRGVTRGETFFDACLSGNLEEVKQLLRCEDITIIIGAPNILFTYKDKNNRTPFYVACQKGHFEIVKELLKLNEKIDVNEPNNNGETPFYIACWIGQTEVVKLLVNERRVDINKKDKNGMTPFLVACENGHIEIVKLLLNEERVDINKADKNGITPLFIACQSGQIGVVKYLLASEREVNLHAKEENGMSAIGQARKKGRTDIVELLESFQNNPNEIRRNLRKELGLPGKYFFQKKVLPNNFLFLFLEIQNSKPSVFLTHTWVKDELNRDNHERVATVNKLLKAQGFKTWFDEDKIVGHIDNMMAQGIDDSDIILVFITKVYMEKVASLEHDNCKGEFTYATNRKKKMIPIVIEPCMRDHGSWIGPLGVRLGGDLHIDMSETGSENDITELVNYLNKI